jgi:acetyl esterase/lipase
MRLYVIVLALMVAGSGVSGQQARSEWGPPAAKAFPPPATLRVVRDIVYARYGDRALRLDLYLPPAATNRPIPGVLVIRGGGWQKGDKEGFGFMAGAIAKAGLAAASIEYRTSSEAPFPAAIHDAKAAVRWLRANAAEYAIDSRALGVIGGSAGGHLAALLGTSDRVAELEGKGGHAGVSSRVAAVVAMATLADLVDMSQFTNSYTLEVTGKFIGAPLKAFGEARRLASPVTHVYPEAAPILLIHSDADPLVPYQQSRLLHRKYREAGARAELVTIAGAPHAFWNYSRWFPNAMERAVAFFQRTLTQPPR